MADWSMGPAVWVPSDYQLSMEPAIWIPGVPIEYAVSTEMLGSSYQYQASIPSSSEDQQRLVEYAAAAATQQQQPREGELVDFHGMEMYIHSPIRVFEKAAYEF